MKFCRALVYKSELFSSVQSSVQLSLSPFKPPSIPMFPSKELHFLTFAAITSAMLINVFHPSVMSTIALFDPFNTSYTAFNATNATISKHAIRTGTRGSVHMPGANSTTTANRSRTVACQLLSKTSSMRLPSYRHTRRRKSKPIAQADLPDMAQKWKDICLASGGDILTNDPCVQLAGERSINALLAGDPCAQQDNADAMIDFANSAGITNRDRLIANAVAFYEHPWNALNIPSALVCQKAPKNSELNVL
ncbi:hypothetical protein HETIRDRAFT_311480 [Heterobasidion irregulare TC 32-1]|uniref:Uncharacterized protein n=1 Tax=Heterobasidion irregulare (strain TC 32-1) TaxID=747525 RepID=W4KJL8_HETIT|nr:uncharacterized protein HETIRDRAFT_311480 [Heterobasidion irregulare TC 32-1]ETW86047.1 hypothetical protein HETIRDRAFT_311480 [Heterobasidion irregulare TC 32-1]